MKIFIFQGKLYVFDKVFKPTVHQEYVYSQAALPIVQGSFHMLVL